MCGSSPGSHTRRVVSEFLLTPWHVFLFIKMKFHNRSIYGCTIAPKGMVPPEDCRYTYNPATKRLYVHIFAWPFKAIHLPGMAGKVKYAQLLNDASEIKMRDEKSDIHAALNAKSPKGALTLELPTIQPNVEVPVIELFLK